MYQYYINMNETKQEKEPKGRITTLYRCGCPCCEKCWFRLDTEHCIYGGPFSGYIKEEEDGTI
jgi:hypothetical protein